MGYLDYLRHGSKMFSKKGAMPAYMVYFIADACNAKCKHCLLADGAHPGWETPTMQFKKQELTLEEVDKITASMGKSLMFLLPTGGEPFLRKDIGEIVKIFYKNTGVRNVGIPTNGSTVVRTLKIVEDVLKACPDLDLGIDVSLDGVGALHDEIRVFPGLFERSVQTYKELKKLSKHYPRLNVNVETTVSSHNDKHLMENYAWFRRELEVDNVFTLLTRGSPKESIAKFFDVKLYEEYADLIEQDMKSGSLSGYDTFPFADIINAKRIVRHRLIAEIAKTNTYQIPCYAGSPRRLHVRERRHPPVRAPDRPQARQRPRRQLRLQEDLVQPEGRRDAEVHPRDEVLLHVRVLPDGEHPLQSPHGAEDPARSGAA